MQVKSMCCAATCHFQAFRRVTIRTQIYEGAPTRAQTVTGLFYGAAVLVALAGGLYVWKSDNARSAVGDVTHIARIRGRPETMLRVTCFDVGGGVRP